MGEGTMDPGHRERLTRVAIELQERENARRARTADEHHLRQAVSEVGVEPRFLEEAAVELERRDAEARRAAEARAARNRKIAGYAGAGVVALGAVALVGWWLAPPDVTPWVQPMDSAAGWGLDTSPGTEAALRFVPEAGRGSVAVLDVEGFAPDANGEYRANLDGIGVPESLWGYETLSVDLAGTLPVARIYLEAGPNERWRSPPLSVNGDWTTHTVPLRAFEHQVRGGTVRSDLLKTGGGWRSVGGDVPDELTQISVKVGQFMNAPDASGELRVDAIRLE